MFRLTSTLESPLRSSFCHILLATAAVAVPVLYGLFDSVVTETGLQYYAERPYWGFNYILQSWLSMPANTVVNFGYIIVGIGWIRKVHTQQRTVKINSGDAYFLYSFSWMSIFYAFVQCTRIIGQTHRAAVLDQWFTLPIFAFGIAWSLHVLNGWNPVQILIIEALSVLSYCFALLWNYGFEVALAIHISIILVSATVVYRRLPTVTSHDAFHKAVICCAGFVFLKLLDYRLAGILPSVFTYLSGHFWSKIADFLQIHYVCVFFSNCKQSADKHK